MSPQSECHLFHYIVKIKKEIDLESFNIWHGKAGAGLYREERTKSAGTRKKASAPQGSFLQGKQPP